jgi:hypothetical protein
MIVNVVISSATRVPATNLDLSTLLLEPTTYRGPLDALTMTGTNQQRKKKTLASLLIELFQDFSDDLTNALQ